MAQDGGEQRFLPPEPSGPEPDLGQDHKPGSVQGDPAQAGGQPPPPTYAPPPGYAPPSPPSGHPQPGSGWQQGPPPHSAEGQGRWEQPPGAPPTWGWQPPPVPDNGAAVAGFSLSLTAGGLLVLTGGLSSVISIACAAFGIFYSRLGRERVERGETPKHRSLAQAGFIIGIVSLVLAVLATIGWIVVVSDGDVWDELERELDEPNGTETSVGLTALRACALALRGAVSLL